MVKLYTSCVQIVATEEDKDPPSEVPIPPRADGLDEDLARHVSAMAYKLALTEEEQQVNISINSVVTCLCNKDKCSSFCQGYTLFMFHVLS